MKILVLGAYGNFGARICRALAKDANIQLVICGRDAKRAAAFAQELGGSAQALALDLNQAELAQAFIKAKAELILHTAGPFQGQGYQVALAAAQAGAHYIDLADGRRFVCDFAAAMDAAFRAAGKRAICGASTVPALSSAVIDQICQQWQSIEHIEYCIAPAQTAPRGAATMAAVMSYCGAPIQVWREGAWQTEYGWYAPVKVEFANIKPRLGALCDIPDLEIFPQHYPGVRTVMFRAALEIGFSQRIFAWLAAWRKMGLIKAPEKLAGLVQFAAPAIDWMGSSVGGMVMRIQGRDAHGQLHRKAWHITADHDHGPEIPCMPAILLARKFARGEDLGIGASTATSCLQLQEFQSEFERWQMQTEIVNEGQRG